MIVEPERYLEASARAGADHLIVHCEPSSNASILHRSLSCGGAEPSHAFDADRTCSDLCGMVLIMTVEPGIWRAVLPEMLPKIRTLRHDATSAASTRYRSR